MLPSVLALVVAVAVAWWSWRGRLDLPLARLAFAARAVALIALIFLLLDPGIANRPAATRPLVLLDNSVSMHGATGRYSEAVRLAASLGDTTTFGELFAGEPGGRSTLLDALSGSLAGGRAVTVVTDGEIADAGSMSADQRAQTTVRLLPRAAGSDIALTEIRAPERISAGDSLAMEIVARRTAGAPDTAIVVVRDSSTVLLRGVIHFGSGDHATLRLFGAMPGTLQGERWLRIERVGAPDAEPDDDVRWWRLTVSATLGVVVIAEAPDWDSRALYRTLKDVVNAPIRGYAQLQRGQWRRMDDLRTVTTVEVSAAARNADLLAVRGDVKSWRTMGRARLLWPPATVAGDWYLSSSGISPLASAFAGTEPDSLPPAPGVVPLDSATMRGWVGATARLSRRGVPVPVIGGVQGREGRTVTIGVDGLARWSLRGGTADQVWRTMIAGAATWLLATPEGDSVRARVSTPVTQRGRAVHFRWTASGSPLPLAIDLRGPRTPRTDTLRFDGAGDAVLALPVGRYSYAIEHGGAGTFAVEPFADELVPGPVTMVEHIGVASRAGSRRSVRELLWLFGLALGGFGTEWLLRRRLGLR